MTTVDRNPFRANLLEGRTLLITGGGTGLGRSMALKCASVGAKIAVVENKETADMTFTEDGLILVEYPPRGQMYHVVIERFPNLESSACDPNNPCSLKWVEKFGFVTIPTMALTAFVAIICLLSIQPKVIEGNL